jgi:hypothetical protein
MEERDEAREKEVELVQDTHHLREQLARAMQRSAAAVVLVCVGSFVCLFVRSVDCSFQFVMLAPLSPVWALHYACGVCAARGVRRDALQTSVERLSAEGIELRLQLETEQAATQQWQQRALATEGAASLLCRVFARVHVCMRACVYWCVCFVCDLSDSPCLCFAAVLVSSATPEDSVGAVAAAGSAVDAVHKKRSDNAIRSMMIKLLKSILPASAEGKVRLHACVAWRFLNNCSLPCITRLLVMTLAVTSVWSRCSLHLLRRSTVLGESSYLDFLIVERRHTHVHHHHHHHHHHHQPCSLIVLVAACSSDVTLTPLLRPTPPSSAQSKRISADRPVMSSLNLSPVMSDDDGDAHGSAADMLSSRNGAGAGAGGGAGLRTSSMNGSHAASEAGDLVSVSDFTVELPAMVTGDGNSVSSASALEGTPGAPSTKPRRSVCLSPSDVFDDLPLEAQCDRLLESVVAQFNAKEQLVAALRARVRRRHWCPCPCPCPCPLPYALWPLTA